MWYDEGLKFSCTQCGKCCTGFEGIVHLSEKEIELIANHLNLSIDIFKKNYLRIVDKKWALREDKENFDCIFYKDKLCTIYNVRPNQCKTYPFWPSILKSKKSWEEEKQFCEGIEHETSTLVQLKTIKEKLNG
jgi:hypothetical protein